MLFSKLTRSSFIFQFGGTFTRHVSVFNFLFLHKNWQIFVCVVICCCSNIGNDSHTHAHAHTRKRTLTSITMQRLHGMVFPQKQRGDIGARRTELSGYSDRDGCQSHPRGPHTYTYRHTHMHSLTVTLLLSFAHR